MPRRGTPRAIFSREASNPILSAADWPYPVHAVFNAGAVRLEDAVTLFLCRVEDERSVSRLGAFWDSSKIGLATPLMETERGWLMLYHGVRVTASGSLYRVGLALLDRLALARASVRDLLAWLDQHAKAEAP